MVRTFASLDGAVPAYDAFLTPAEHRERDRHVAAERETVTRRQVGESEAGRPIHALRVGSGPETALFVGAPHANEPVGSTTCRFLLDRLAADADLRASLPYEFVFVPVADPDGARLNRGWFDGPFVPRNYALNFYRADADRDVEWRFPFEHRRLSFDDPPPETAALARVIRDERPRFVASLHNGAVGGCFSCLSRPMPDLHGALRAMPGEYDLPVHRGEPDAAYMRRFDDGVWSVPTTADQYEYVDENLEVDPADIDSGGGTLDYARTRCPAADQIIVEVPYYRADGVASEAPAGRTRREVLLAGVDARLAVASLLSDGYERVADALPAGRLRDAVAGWAEGAPAALGRKREAVADGDDPDLDEPATEATVTSETLAGPFYALLYCGPFLRAVDAAIHWGDGDAATLRAVRRETLAAFDRRWRDVVEGLQPEPVPIRDLVALQARATLSCLDHLAGEGV